MNGILGCRGGDEWRGVFMSIIVNKLCSYRTGVFGFGDGFLCRRAPPFSCGVFQKLGGVFLISGGVVKKPGGVLQKAGGVPKIWRGVLQILGGVVRKLGGVIKLWRGVAPFGRGTSKNGAGMSLLCAWTLCRLPLTLSRFSSPYFRRCSLSLPPPNNKATGARRVPC